LFSPIAQLTHTITNMGHRSAKLQSLTTPRMGGLHGKDDGAAGPGGALLSGLSPRNSFGFSPAVSPRNILSSALLHSPASGGGPAGLQMGGAGTSRSASNSRATSPFRYGGPSAGAGAGMAAGAGASGPVGSNGSSGLMAPASAAGSSTSPLPSPQRHLSLSRSSFSPPPSPSARSPAHAYSALLQQQRKPSVSSGLGVLPTPAGAGGAGADAKEGGGSDSRASGGGGGAVGELLSSSASASPPPTSLAALGAGTAAAVGSSIPPNPANLSKQRRFNFAMPPPSTPHGVTNTAAGTSGDAQPTPAGAAVAGLNAAGPQPGSGDSTTAALPTPSSFFS